MARASREEDFSEYVVQRRTQLRRIAYLICGDVPKAADLDLVGPPKLAVFPLQLRDPFRVAGRGARTRPLIDLCLPDPPPPATSRGAHRAALRSAGSPPTSSPGPCARRPPSSHRIRSNGDAPSDPAFAGSDTADSPSTLWGSHRSQARRYRKWVIDLFAWFSPGPGAFVRDRP
jgi:hypothetical protein